MNRVCEAGRAKAIVLSWTVSNAPSGLAQSQSQNLFRTWVAVSSKTSSKLLRSPVCDAIV
jgi:hypothetical protein